MKPKLCKNSFRKNGLAGFIVNPLITIHLLLFACIFMLPVNVMAQANSSSSTEKTVNLTMYVGSTQTIDPATACGLNTSTSYLSNVATVAYVSDNSAFSITSSLAKTSTLSNTSRTQIYYYKYNITALKIGVFSIKCSFTNYNWTGATYTNYTVTYVITVTEIPTVKSISIPQSITLNVGESYTIVPVIVDSDAVTTLTWSSSVPSVATINNGVVSAKTVGTTIITCTASNGVKSQCTVIVKGILATNIEIMPKELDLLINNSIQLSVNFTPANTTNKRINWTSSDNSIALVTSEGLLLGVSEGHCNVYASTTDGSDITASSIVHVTSPFIEIESISFKNNPDYITLGEIFHLETSIEPTNASQKTLKWTSSNPDIASVDDEGNIKALNIGKSQITASTTDGSNLAATCTIYVKSADKSKYENVIYLENKTCTSGSSLHIPVYLDNIASLTALQFDIVLPEYFSLSSSDGLAIFPDNERIDPSSHQITLSTLDSHTIRVVCHSPSNTAINGNSGQIFSLNIESMEDTPNDIYDIILKDIILSATDGTKYEIPAMSNEIRVISAMPGDADGDGTVDVADIVMVINYIMGKDNLTIITDAADYDADGIIDVADIVGIVNYIMHGPSQSIKPKYNKSLISAINSECSLEVTPFTLPVGSTSKTVSLDLYNPNIEFTAVECDIILPNGISIASKKNGRPKVDINTLSERTDGTHTVSCVDKGDGIYHLACYSDQNDIFYDEMGAIIDILLSIDTEILPGFYTISVDNVKLVEVDGQKTLPQTGNSTALIGDGGKTTNATIYGSYDSSLIADFSSATCRNTSICSFDLVNAKGIESVNKILTGNPNTLYYIKESQSITGSNNIVVCDDYENYASEIDLTDGFAFNTSVDFKAEKFTYNRDFTSDSWQAFYLPCSVNYESWNLLGSMAQLEEIDATSDLPYLVWNLLNGEDLNPNLTYIFKPNFTGSVTFNDSNVVFVISPEEDTIGQSFVLNGETYYVRGNFLPKTDMFTSKAYALSKGNFHPASSDNVVLNPMRMYITVSPAINAPARINMRINGDNVSGIEDSAIKAVHSDEYINMSGIKIGNPSNGLYIVNGKKVFINK